MVYTGTLFWRALSISLFHCFPSALCAMQVYFALMCYDYLHSGFRGKAINEKHTFHCAFSNAVTFSLPSTQQWIATECYYMTCIRLGWAVWHIGIILPLHFIAVRIVTFNVLAQSWAKVWRPWHHPKILLSSNTSLWHEIASIHCIGRTRARRLYHLISASMHRLLSKRKKNSFAAPLVSKLCSPVHLVGAAHISKCAQNRDSDSNTVKLH